MFQLMDSFAQLSRKGGGGPDFGPEPSHQYHLAAYFSGQTEQLSPCLRFVYEAAYASSS